ncbi:CHAT domain protein [Planctomycetes bacterium Poly30]|uniref:CHAT domain protein n=1 Tax=Saltatorellus ferox TaxID=2528018 RepID=A0A518EQ51_9BACT|nr:CHAT domain protein [Planctomycetes bacterium Poly30]
MVAGLREAIAVVLAGFLTAAIAVGPSVQGFDDGVQGFDEEVQGFEYGAQEFDSEEVVGVERPKAAPLLYVASRIARFHDEKLDDESRYAILGDLGKFAKEWLEAAHVPIPEEACDGAEAVAEAIHFLAEYAGRWVSEESISGFQGRWLDFVLSDSDSGGVFGPRVRWRELHRRVQFLARIGDLQEALRLIGHDGEVRIEEATTPWDLRLRAARASLYRLGGAFERALGDLDLSVADLQGADWATQLVIAQARFSTETDLGRLELADLALGAMTRLIESRGETASPQLTGLLWEARIKQLLSTGNNAQALRYADRTLDELGDDLALSADGMRRRDEVLYLAALAEMRLQRPPRDFSRATYATLETARYLEGQAYIDRHTRHLATLIHAEILHAQGEDLEALRLLRSVQTIVTPSSPLARPSEQTSANPLLATRLAAKCFEVALAIGDVEAIERSATELRTAFNSLLDAWATIAVQPSGIGFLQYAERRHALQLVLESALLSGQGREARAFDWLLAADSCSTVARHLDARAASPADVVALCGDLNATLLYFVPTELTTHRFLVRAEGVEHTRLEGTAEFRRHFGPVLNELRQRPKAEAPWPPPSIEEDLRWLAKRMVPEGASDTLIYAGLDGFGFHAVEVLPDRDGHPIGLTREVTQTPSVNALVKLQDVAASRAPRDRPSLSIFALSDAGEEPRTGTRLRAIQFGLKDFVELQEASGSKTSFERPMTETAQGLVSALESGPDLFIALTHGSEGAGDGDVPGIYVRSDSGARQSREVIRADSLLQLLPSSSAVDRPAVALLAVCSAGFGPRRLGDAGASDFSGALLQAGIPVALTARAPIDQDAAKAFIKAFARGYLREKLSAGSAMLLARREVASIDGFYHPHFWATLQLFGWSDTRVR